MLGEGIVLVRELAVVTFGTDEVDAAAALDGDKRLEEEEVDLDEDELLLESMPM